LPPQPAAVTPTIRTVATMAGRMHLRIGSGITLRE
jgi:hypothetical protein